MMVWYVGFIAILNLGVGYALAVVMERSKRRAMYAAAVAFDGDEG
jgi:hypothetical protein